MKSILTLLAIISLAALSACSFLPPQTDTPPTARQETVSADLQSVADAIRHAENAAMTPAEFNHFLETWIALIPAAQPYIKDAELAYAVALAAGNLTVAEGEKLAARYDS